MHAIPPGVVPGDLQVTGVACPECAGVLGVRAEGRDASLQFECRTGHTYDVPELLASKEEMLDRKLWTAATALSELIALLEDLARRIAPAAEGSDVAAHYRQRASDARRLSAALTDILRANRPIDLSAVEPGARGPVDEPASSDGTGKTGHREPDR